MDFLICPWLLENVWLVPLYPLLAFLVVVLGGGFKLFPGKSLRNVAMGLTIGGTFVGLLHAKTAVLALLTKGANFVPIEHNWTWLSAGAVKLSLGFVLDPLSIMMLFVVTFISLFIQIYTHGYMGKDPGYAKFYSFLALFNFSMLGLVLSTNLFQMYIFWELVGVCSYLLIGFWMQRESAAKAQLKAFLMNRVGDFGLLVGILSLLFFSFHWWQTAMVADPSLVFLSFAGMAEAGKAALEVAGPVGFAVIVLLIFMGPMAKSAQLPLHTWLPDAMEGPTPISALIHAATMVAAGIYMVARVYPLFQLSSTAMTVVAIIGTLTAVLGATIALTQYDIKKALAYSTVSQLGFMMAGMGVGAFTAGLFHLFTHAFFKAMLFLGSGSVIHACEDEQDMRQMGGLMKKLPVTGWTYLIGTIAISGLLWTSGFWSKDEILVGALAKPWIFWTLLITAGFTTFYMFRTYFMTFTGTYRGHAHVHHEDPVMVSPLVVLAVPSLLIGLLLSGVIPGLPSFAAFIHPATEAAHHGAHHAPGFFTTVGIQSMVAGFIGLTAAYLMYSPNRMIDPAIFVKALKPLHTLFVNKWFFDEFYMGFVDNVYLALARLSSAFDKTVVDGIVNLTGRTVMFSGNTLRLLQSGKIQVYLLALLFGTLVLTLLFIFGML